MKRRQAEWLHCSEIKSINLPSASSLPLPSPFSCYFSPFCLGCPAAATHPSCHDFHEQRLLSLSNRAINQNDLNFMPRSWAATCPVAKPVKKRKRRRGKERYRERVLSLVWHIKLKLEHKTGREVYKMKWENRVVKLENLRNLKLL